VGCHIYSVEDGAFGSEYGAEEGFAVGEYEEGDGEAEECGEAEGVGGGLYLLGGVGFGGCGG